MMHGILFYKSIGKHAIDAGNGMAVGLYDMSVPKRDPDTVYFAIC